MHREADSDGRSAQSLLLLHTAPQLSAVEATLVAIATLAVVAIGDHLTGWFFLFDFFYLIPLVLVTAYVGKRAGVLMALGCTVAWTVVMVVQRHPMLVGAPAPVLIWVWNFAMRFAVQSAFALLVGRLREDLVEQRRLNQELNDAVSEVHRLGALLPICAWCKKIRDDAGYWKELDRYMQEQDIVRFTHGICPDCVAKIKRQYEKK